MCFSLSLQIDGIIRQLKGTQCAALFPSSGVKDFSVSFRGPLASEHAMKELFLNEIYKFPFSVRDLFVCSRLNQPFCAQNSFRREKKCTSMWLRLPAITNNNVSSRTRLKALLLTHSMKNQLPIAHCVCFLWAR